MSNIKLVLLGAVSIKAIMLLADPAVRLQINNMIGTASWADQAVMNLDAGGNTAAEDAADWGGKEAEDSVGWDDEGGDW